MPQWVVLLGIAVAGWLVFCVFGGLLAGRALGACSRLLRRRAAEPDAAEELPQPAPRRRAA